MDGPRCPHCLADLTGEPIPIEDRPVPTATHYLRVVAHVPEGTDVVVAWSCLDCGGWWHRFPEGETALRKRVAKMMRDWT
jgi:hypothetical protein